MRRWTGATALLLACVAGCDTAFGWLDAPVSSAHAEYVGSLEDAGLDGSPAAARWIASAGEALVAADSAILPFEGSGWFDAENPEAYAIRLAPPDGRWLSVRARLNAAEPARVFLDVYRMPDPAEGPPILIASDVDTSVYLSVRVRGRDDLIVRLQPELLRGGSWELDVTEHDEEPTDDATS